MTEPLAKVLHSMMKEWRILSVKAIISREKRRTLEGNLVPGGGIEHITFTYTCTYSTYTIFMQQRLIKNTFVKN